MTLVLGVAYPALIALVGANLFPAQAGSSLVVADDGRILGSWLLAQEDSRAGRFRPRPSAAGWNGEAGAGSNLGPTSAGLAAAAGAREMVLKADNPGQSLPPDLLFASGSGLDPHLTPGAALFQVPRVAGDLGVPEGKIRALVEDLIEKPQLGFIGEERVNVLRLNRELDRLYGTGDAENE